ncbi:MAG: sporulation protein [Chloroflexota bacterium]
MLGKLFNRANATLTLQLDSGTGIYTPGDQVQVQITARTEKDLSVREGRVIFRYEERYAVKKEEYDSHDEEWETTTSWHMHDYIVADHIFLADQILSGGTEKTFTVTFTVPTTAHPSYEGSIIKTSWTVKATLDRERAFDVNEEIALNIGPTRTEKTMTVQLGESSHPDACRLSLWMPNQNWVQGETIEGKLLLHPKDDFSVRQIRLELLGEEEVPEEEGNWDEHIVHTIQILGETDFQPDSYQEIPFQFTLPTTTPITFQTRRCEVASLLRAVLDRPMATDYTVSANINVYRR